LWNNIFLVEVGGRTAIPAHQYFGGKETLNKLEAEASSFSSWLPSNDMELKEWHTFVEG
jgi:hypothetical protein